MPTQYIAGSRSISADIIDDKRVNSLPSFLDIVAHFRILLKMDNLGRTEADPDLIRAMIFTRNPSVSIKRVAQTCQYLHDEGLFFLYEANGNQYFQSARYDRQKMVGHMKRASALPPPDPEHFYDWLINIRKDERFVGVEKDTCIELVNTMLMPCIEHVKNMERTGSERVSQEMEEEKEVKWKRKGKAGSDNDFERVKEVFEKDFGMLTPLLGKEIEDALARWPVEWILEALKIAVDNNARNWKYAKRILERWEMEGRERRGQPEAPVKDLGEYD